MLAAVFLFTLFVLLLYFIFSIATLYIDSIHFIFIITIFTFAAHICVFLLVYLCLLRR